MSHYNHYSLMLIILSVISYMLISYIAIFDASISSFIPCYLILSALSHSSELSSIISCSTSNHPYHNLHHSNHYFDINSQMSSLLSIESDYFSHLISPNLYYFYVYVFIISSSTSLSSSLLSISIILMINYTFFIESIVILIFFTSTSRSLNLIFYV
jgi:hypothetical protein